LDTAAQLQRHQRAHLGSDAPYVTQSTRACSALAQTHKCLKTWRIKF